MYLILKEAQKKGKGNCYNEQKNEDNDIFNPEKMNNQYLQQHYQLKRPRKLLSIVNISLHQDLKNQRSKKIMFYRGKQEKDIVHMKLHKAIIYKVNWPLSNTKYIVLQACCD